MALRAIGSCCRLIGCWRCFNIRTVSLKSPRRLCVRQHHAELFAVSYSETAAQSWEIYSLPYDLAMLLADQGQMLESVAELRSWLRTAEAKPLQKFVRIQAQSIL